MSKKDIEILQKKLNQEIEKRVIAENLLQEKTQEVINLNKNLSYVINKKTQAIESFFENIIDPSILMDLYGNVLKMNKSAVDFFGYDYKKEAFNVTEILYKKDLEYTYESFNTLKKTGFIKNYQARIYTKNKTVKWIQVNARTINNDEGKPAFTLGIVRDITKKIRQEVVFDNRKKILDAIIDNSSFGIVLLNKTYKIVKTNKAFQQLLDYTSTELKAMIFSDFSKQLKLDEVYRKFNEVIDGKIENFSVKRKIQKKNGKEIIIKVNVTPVKSEKGSLKYFLAVIEDITEEQKKEALIAFLNELMSSILGKTDKNEISHDISQKIMSLLGFEVCEIVFYNENKQLLNYLSEKFGEETADLEDSNERGIVALVAKTGKPIICNDVSNDERYLSAYSSTKSEIAVPITFNKEVIGVINAESDAINFITQEHVKTLSTVANVIGTKLKSVLNAAEKKVTEKENKTLLKNLKKSNKELKDFAYIVSHDLKSPLRSMSTLLTWLQEDCEGFLNDDLKNSFSLVFKKIDKMDLLINGILKYASVDKVVQETKSINLNKVLNDVLETIDVPENVIINKKTILPTVQGDNFRLFQLFQNLISNAIKYNNKEEKIIIINSVEKNNFWEFSFQDNGIGIAKKYHKKIFEVFQMLEESENSSGVGLSIVTKIIDFYGGKIWINSVINEGTTFYFTLPKQ